MTRPSTAARACAAAVTCGALAALALAAPAEAAPERRGKPSAFGHVATFDVTSNGSEVAEIVDLTDDARTAVYTDSATGVIGFVDVADPADPQPAGTVDLGGEPTSVALLGDLALAAVNTSESFTDPSGYLAVVDTATREIVQRLDLGGQPDSVTVSPDGSYAAIAIENERDEDVDDGLIPQLPAGFLAVVALTGDPSSWTVDTVDLTGIAEYAPGDPEPEYVDINGDNRAVVTLQENNHIAVVDLPSLAVVADFSAGEVTLENVDATEDDLIDFSETITKRREPDTVQWITDDLFATANEGDYTDEAGDEGGSRGFTVFSAGGDVVFESGTSFEYALAAAGHYPEGRSENKGVEPEALEFGHLGRTPVLIVGSERANALGVYDVSKPRNPKLLQVLPTGVGPEGIKVKDDVLAVANETAVDDVIPSVITFYTGTGRSAYPQLVSDRTANGSPIPWVAMSGLVGDPRDAGTLYGVSDSFLADGFVYTIDVDKAPATITDRVRVSDPGGLAGPGGLSLDLEGVAVAPEGGFWLASEGTNGTRPNAIIRTDAAGAVEQYVPIPADVAATQTNSGFEGLAVTTAADGTTEYVYATQQREWRGDAANTVKIHRYEVATGEWTYVTYEKAAPAAAGWVGLSEITLLPGGGFAVIERDNQLGPNAAIKKVYEVDLAGADFRPFGSQLVSVAKSELYDLLPALQENSVWTPDKLEGFAVAADRTAYAVTDNDGLDDAVGQTVFLDLGLLPGTSPACAAVSKLPTGVSRYLDRVIAQLVARFC